MRIWPTLLFLLGPILGSDSVVSSQLLDQGSVSIVARSPRLICGQYRCVQNATCEGGQCSCEGFKPGDGRFNCYDHDQSRIQVVANRFMSLTNHDETKSVPINWPCKYRLTRIVTKGTGTLASCDAQILGMNKISNGKIILHGVQIYLEMRDTSGEVYRLAIRKTGSSRMGIYRFTEWSKNIREHEGIVKRQTSGFDFGGSGSGDGGMTKRSAAFDSDDEDFAGDYESHEEIWGQRRDLHFGQGEQPMKFEIDSDSFAVLALESCGLRVKFRPATEDPTQDDLHGLTITVDKPHAPVRFPDSHTYLHGNLSPITAYDRTVADVNPVSDAEEAFLSVLKYGAVQDEPTLLGEQCANAIHTYQSFCTSYDDTKVKNCHTLLDNAKLVMCLDKSHTDPSSGSSSASSSVLYLVTLCLRRVCDQSDHACTLLYTGLDSNDCGQHWEPIRTLLDCPRVFRNKRSTSKQFG